ncbi:DUF523 domain-containing protein [Caproicibacter fermentans]|uniref:DUF523 domain-containing protein n=1 Tax=Caproicibacter fermentans TaxID=2576756 RepID=A0A7G8TDN7_9FIRM|nr:DUF523 domain-containing protein [Caproicibacter fermentans]QNK41728.1 DUF523 domain-containing protein [Caproicibacter fermentans]
MNLLVSACLLGVRCRYSGTGCPNNNVIKLAEKHHLIPICPEQLGGLSTPRDPVELVSGRAATRDGSDRTEQFLRGAEEALRLARLYRCGGAVLKSRSPSCGFGKIYDGTFSGTLTEGNGVAAKRLAKAGLFLWNEENCGAISESAENNEE